MVDRKSAKKGTRPEKLSQVEQYLDNQLFDEARLLRKLLDCVVASDLQGAHAVIGYAVGRGHSSPATRNAIDERDLVLRKWNSELGHDHKVIAQLMKSFQSDVWPRNRERDEMDPKFQGTWREYAWRAFRHRDQALSAEHIKRKLGPKKKTLNP